MCCKTDKSRDLIRSVPVRSALRPSRLCRAFPRRSILDLAEFTLSERSESNGLEMTRPHVWNGNVLRSREPYEPSKADLHA